MCDKNLFFIQFAGRRSHPKNDQGIRQTECIHFGKRSLRSLSSVKQQSNVRVASAEPIARTIAAVAMCDENLFFLQFAGRRSHPKNYQGISQRRKIWLCFCWLHLFTSSKNVFLMKMWYTLIFFWGTLIKNPSIYNIIRWFTWTPGQKTPKSFPKTFPWKKILFSERNFFLSSCILIKSFFQTLNNAVKCIFVFFLYVVIFCSTAKLKLLLLLSKLVLRQ